MPPARGTTTYIGGDKTWTDLTDTDGALMETNPITGVKPASRRLTRFR